MRKIVQQMLKGEEVTFCEKTLRQLEKDKEVCDKLLQHFKNVLNEEEYEQLLKYLDAEKIFYQMKAEDLFAEGLRVGILLGIDTAGVLDVENSILYKIMYGKELYYENLKPSAESELLLSNYYYKAKLPQKTEEQKELSELEETNAGIYFEKEEAHYVAGIRKGIVLGVESAKVLQRKEERE